MEQFFIRLTGERDYYEKHACMVRKITDADNLIVELEPPMPGYIFDEADDIALLLLTPAGGAMLAPKISAWPCAVNMCVPAEYGDWQDGPWRVLDVGELTQVPALDE